jgi:NAD(P)-dependent dehydrogenase (short-subunit alcohol dehydrogenase family)
MTGGGRGIGRALAVELRDRGHEVIVADNGCAPDGRTAFEAPRALDGVRWLDVDLATAQGRSACTWWNGEPPDALVHAAAVTHGPCDRLMEVNLLAPILLTDAWLPHLKASGGAVLFFSSGVVDEPNVPHERRHYAASKGGLEAYGHVVARAVDTYIVRPSARTRLNPNAATTPETVAAACAGLLERRPLALRGWPIIPGRGGWHYVTR